jgi:predicted NAD/FAD-dependent oxidoreductase
MAVVALLQGEGISETEILTRYSGEIFSTLTDEKKKGISGSPAWTLTFSPEWSKAVFELGDEELKASALDGILKKWPAFRGSVEIKKWRYSKPETGSPDPFAQIRFAPDLYLAGDAFCDRPGRTPLARAIHSALALATHFQKQ